MGLDLTQGGHLTHGFYTEKRKVSASAKFFRSLQYKVNLDTGIIDYDALEEAAMEFKPKLIIAGYSAYPRDLDYKRFRDICDKVGAYLHADMAHLSGLIAAKAMNDPFEYADVVTSTTHKSLRGPRSGMIFARTEITDNHIVLMSCIDKGLTGSKMENACDQVHITLNKNTIIGDKSAVTPGGVRIGTPAVTTRGYMEEDMREVGRFLDELFKISLNIQSEKGKKLTDFRKGLSESKEIEQLGI